MTSGLASKGCDVAVAGYVDNFAVFGIDPDAVNSGLARISERLRGWGLTVHEEEPANPTGQFVGLYFNGESGFVSIAPKRIRNIKSAIDELLSQQFCTGRTLQLLTGHCTWAMMTRREGLSILNSCFAFIHHFGLKPGRLWPSVRKELERISSLPPLFRMTVNCGWAASDSSPWGIGVCSRKLNRDIVSTLGSQCEKWRFRFDEAMRARKHALHTDLDTADNGIFQNESISSFIIDKGFNAVPQELLVAEDWKVVWSKPWKYKANILNTDARALAWSFEHILRANRCIGKRVVCLCDNMPVVLGCLKGRAKSGHLLRPLGHIAALSLATGSKIAPRWVVSENNVADKPSRAIGAWHSAGLERWWDSFEPSQLGQSDHAQAKASRTSSKSDAPTEGGANQCGSKRDDLLGVKKRADPNSERLSTSDDQISELVFATSALPGLPGFPGLSLGRIYPRPVQPGQGEAAVRFFTPTLGRPSSQTLPQTVRAFKGWSLAAPGMQRLPLPIEVLGAVLGVLCSKRLHQLALRLFLQFTTYMRPGECSNLRIKQLVPPQMTAGSRFNLFAVLLRPAEDEIPGKTGVFDLFQLVSNRPPESLLWVDPHSLLVDEFMAAQQILNLEHLNSCLYTLRHGGATHDILTRRRPMLEVKQRDAEGPVGLGCIAK